MDRNELCMLGLADVAERIRQGELSSVEVTRAVLDRIEAVDARLHAYVCVLEDSAVRRAEWCDAELATNRKVGPLHGVPVAVKDLCAMTDTRTTCASRVFADRVTDHDAAVVERLQAAGAVIVGKLNLTEFAYAGYHPELVGTDNPWCAGHWPGLSSSGSGAATAAGLCYAAIGTDTGGSIRYPSAANGVVGIKPTFGRTSRFGVFPLSHTLDHVGPLARTVADAAIVLDAISGSDDRDPATLRGGYVAAASGLGKSPAGMTVGLDEAYCTQGVEAAVADAVSDAVGALAALGVRIVPVRVEILDEVVSAWMSVCAADAMIAHADLFPRMAEHYGPMFRGLLESGAAVSGVDYARAIGVGVRQRRLFAKLFENVDALVCPALSHPAKPTADRSDEVAHVGASFLFTAPYNLSGNPTVTLPCGFSQQGLPLALQLVGPMLGEAELCRLGDAYQNGTDWHRRHPDLP